MITTIQVKITRNKLKYSSYVPDCIVTINETPDNPQEKEIFFKPMIDLLNSMLHQK